MTALASGSGNYDNVFHRSSEFRHAIRNNTYAGFSLSLITIIFAAVLSIILLIENNSADPVKSLSAPFGRSLIVIDIIPTIKLPPKASALPSGGSTGGVKSPTEITTEFNTVPDDVHVPVKLEYANLDEIINISDGSSNNLFGNGTRLGRGTGFAPAPAPPPEPVLEENPFDLNDVQKLPVIDLAKICSKIVYPRIALQIGIEGKVIVKALIGKDGKVTKAEAEEYDSKIFVDAAIKAVMACSYTPAENNDYPVACWVRIPINFKLSK